MVFYHSYFPGSLADRRGHCSTNRQADMYINSSIQAQTDGLMAISEHLLVVRCPDERLPSTSSSPASLIYGLELEPGSIDHLAPLTLVIFFVNRNPGAAK